MADAAVTGNAAAANVSGAHSLQLFRFPKWR
jgi:hypothetical protein